MRRTQDDIQDELWVLRCQEGDVDALSALIARWQPKLTGFAWRMLGEREAARDVVQDAWMAIVRGLNRLDDPARFRTWAYRIVRNKCADRLRRHRLERKVDRERRAAAVTGESTDNRTAAAEVTDVGSQLRDALERLPTEQRTVLWLHYLDAMSVTEIALTMEVPVGTVKSRLHHARRHLREILERTEP